MTAAPENTATIFARPVHRLRCFCGFTQIQLTGNALHLSTTMRCYFCRSRIVPDYQPRPFCLLKHPWRRR
jgi:hypothetical protein